MFFLQSSDQKKVHAQWIGPSRTSKPIPTKDADDSNGKPAVCKPAQAAVCCICSGFSPEEVGDRGHPLASKGKPKGGPAIFFAVLFLSGESFALGNYSTLARREEGSQLDQFSDQGAAVSACERRVEDMGVRRHVSES